MTKSQSFANSAIKDNYNDLSKAYESINQSIAKFESSSKGKSRLINQRIKDLHGALNIIEKKMFIEKKNDNKINSKISQKFNISRYGNVGHEVQDGNKVVFVSNSSKDDYTNWLLAVDYAKEYFKKKKSTLPSIRLVWKDNPDGGQIASYKMGSIMKYNNSYQIRYFGTIGEKAEHASSLANAKLKLDKITQEKIKNQSGMKKPTTKKAASKKPTAKQLAARKRFSEMAKNGTLAKKRATATKKKPSLKKPASKGLTTLCAKTVGVTGRRKKDGTQKKGYVATKGGTLKKKAPAKKK